jgi:hypothetical protein
MLSKFPAAIARNAEVNATIKSGILTPTLFRRSILILIVAIFASIMLQPHGAWAHSGQSHPGGMGGGHFHGGNFNNGNFHGGNFNNGHFHGNHFNDGHFNPGHFNPGHFPHRGSHARVIIVPPLVGYYPPPVYYYSPPVAAQTAPMTFIEQESDGTTINYWYYCADPAGYYPYVQQCPAGWQVVEANSY